MKVLAVLQARVSSSRLPSKVLAPILGKPMIERQIERLLRATLLDKIIVATSDQASDDLLADLCAGIGLACHRGSLGDVLGRFAEACRIFGPADHVVRLTGDCPLTDPEVIDMVVRHHIMNEVDYTSNALQPSWPDGLDVEIMRSEALYFAAASARLPSEREHVTPYIHTHPNEFRIANIKSETDLSNLRWTVDEPDDLEFVREVYSALYPQNPAFSSGDILDLLKHKPDLKQINSNHIRNEGYAKSLASDITII